MLLHMRTPLKSSSNSKQRSPLKSFQISLMNYLSNSHKQHFFPHWKRVQHRNPLQVTVTSTVVLANNLKINVWFFDHDTFKWKQSVFFFCVRSANTSSCSCVPFAFLDSDCGCREIMNNEYIAVFPSALVTIVKQCIS